MKKIIATALCLTLATPCFAASRYHDKYPNRGFHNHKHQCYDRCAYNDHHNRHHYTRTSERTRTIGAVAGIAGIAMIISAIVD